MSAKRNLLIGVGVGLVFGILFAPRKGSKTRRKIAKRGTELRDGWNNLKDSFSNAITKTEDRVDDFIEKTVENTVYVSPPKQDKWEA